MDPFYAFLVFAVLLVLEMLASQTWAAPYFRLGIPVYFIRARLDDTLDEQATAMALQEQFKSTPLHPTISFKPVGPGQIALRETLFENRGGIRYLPVMHALVRLHAPQRLMTLTGYLNWSILAALVYIVYRCFHDRSFIPVALLVLFILTFSYIFQAGVAGRIGLALQKLGKEK